MEKIVQNINLDNAKGVEVIPGLVRTTLAYTEQQMVCHFTVRAGVEMQMHTHLASQIGYII